MTAAPANSLPAADEGDDLISPLPDCVLITILSLLPLYDGARTTTLSRRWRRLWPSAPLRLLDSSAGALSAATISQILASHQGIAVQFHLTIARPSPADLGSCLHSLSAKRLQELILRPPSDEPLLLPPSIFECRSLRSAELTNCRLPEDAAAAGAVSFPRLAELTLRLFSIPSPAALQGLLASCPMLASLSLDRVFGCRVLRVRSGTLRSLTVSVSLTRRHHPEESVELERLVVEDAPALERLLAHDINWGPSIRVAHAPRLQMLGYLGVGITELQLGSTLFQSMSAVRLATQLRCLRTLALEMVNLQVKPVVDFLYCFPCLETLYITVHLQAHMVVPRSMKLVKYGNVHDSIECLNHHLRTVVLKGYGGQKHEVQLARFLIQHARVLKVMKFMCDNDCNLSWLTIQKRRLDLENRASLGAQFVFEKFSKSYIRLLKQASNITIVDPFNI